MSKTLNSALDDPTVVHRLCFAARTLPVGLPSWRLLQILALWENVDAMLLGMKQKFLLRI